MKGKKTGGRRKGTPNHVTSDARAVLSMVYERRVDDLDRWIKETGDGYQATHFLSDGTAIPYLEKNPGKAAELLLRMAEYFVPRLSRAEVTGKDGGPLTVTINKLPPTPPPKNA